MREAFRVLRDNNEDEFCLIFTRTSKSFLTILSNLGSFSSPLGALLCVMVGAYRYGAPGRIRTSDPLVRSQVLYPAELRARNFVDQLGGCLLGRFEKLDIMLN